MINSIDFLIYEFVVNLLCWILLKRIFKLDSGFLIIFVLQILSLIVELVSVYFQLQMVSYIALNFFAGLIICLLTTNSYRFKDFFLFFFSYILMWFSIFGFSNFMVVLERIVFKDISGKNVANLFDSILLILTLLYMYLLYLFAYFFLKRKKVKDFLVEVSFFAFGKHIKITGLLDSGNLLHDKTGDPVIIISVYALKKYLPSKVFFDVLDGNFSVLNIGRTLKFKTAGNSNFEMPILSVGQVEVVSGGVLKNKTASIGIVNQKFNNGYYDSLVPSDFV